MSTIHQSGGASDHVNERRISLRGLTAPNPVNPLFVILNPRLSHALSLLSNTALRSYRPIWTRWRLAPDHQDVGELSLSKCVAQLC